MRINTNIPSLTSYNALTSTTSALQGSIAKLSTGLRINSAADDAAGLAISEKMRAQYHGLDQATNNAQDAISMIQTAEGALNETHSILQRMRELSVQSANDTLTAEDRAYIQLEIDQLREEIDRISTTTQFNKKQLLDGSAAALWSTSDLATKVIVNGGLREVDQFGQKRSVEGNYKITIKADPGDAQIQKSSVFKIKSKNVITDLHMNDNFSVKDVNVRDVPPGEWTISLFGTGENPVTHQVQSGYEQASFGYWNTVGAGASYGASGKFAFLPADEPNGRPFDSVNNFGFSSAGISAVETLAHDGVDMNVTTLWEVVAVDKVNQTVTFDVKTKGLSVEGDAVSFTGTTLTIGVDGMSEGDIDALGIHVTDGAFYLIDTFSYPDGRVEDFYEVGARSAMTFMPALGKDYAAIDIQGVVNSYEWDGAWGLMRWDVGGRNGSVFAIDNTKLANKTVTFDTWFINLDNGIAHDSAFTIDFGEDIARTDMTDASVWGSVGKVDIAKFEALVSGMTARSTTKLSDLDTFWDANGKFLLTDPQTITLTQGDGKQAKVTFYGDDTIGDVRRKLNDAIALGLDQGRYLSGAGSDSFVTYQEYTHYTETVEAPFDPFDPDSPVFQLWTEWFGSGPAQNTVESVAGTLVVRSLVPGAEGELSFSGGEDLMKALGFNVIQQSRESRYSANVVDAHSGNIVATDVKVTGNKLVGVLHDNIDVEFDSMANTDAIWSEQMRKFVLARSNTVYETIVHLSDNTTTFQIGANAGEDMSVDIGDMSAEALGVDGIIVTDRESASRSISKIDAAISRVSLQRAKLGAYQNRLEHTINNLTTASTNMKSSESRIRDVDMAKEMMRFTRLNILMQAGTSMLAQANQLPQNVLSLLR